MITNYSCYITGVYLLFNKTVYANNSIIQIAKLVDMGLDIAHNQGLQCITDRKPCCRNTGEWLFPNGTLVPTEDSARSFYKSSGDNGNVSLNLLRTNSVLPLLTGMFCCILPDANSIVDAVCVEISELTLWYASTKYCFLFLLIDLTIYAEIGNTGISTAGKDYTLTCNVSGLEKFSSIVSYKWIKNNGTEIQVGFNSNTLSFSPLRLSDAGLYTCHVSVSSDDASRIHAANTSSQPFEVNVNGMSRSIYLQPHSNYYNIDFICGLYNLYMCTLI